MRTPAFSILTLGMTLSATALATAEDSLSVIEKELEAKWSQVKTFSATMHVTAELTQSGIALSTDMTGPVTYQRMDDGVMRFRSELKGKAKVGRMGLFGLDTSILTVSDGVTQYAENRVWNKITVTKTDGSKRKNSEPGGGSKALSDARDKYDLRVLPAETLHGRPVHVIEGRPKAGEKPEFPGLDRVLMYFDQETGIQARMALLNRAGDVLTEVTFSNVQKNPPVDPQLFVYQIPKGAEVIDKTTEGNT